MPDQAREASSLVARYREHRAAAAVVTAAAPAVLVLVTELAPPCNCENIATMAYLWLAVFMLLPTVLILTASGRAAPVRWRIALLSLGLSLLLTLSTFTGL